MTTEIELRGNKKFGDVNRNNVNRGDINRRKYIFFLTEKLKVLTQNEITFSKT